MKYICDGCEITFGDDCEITFKDGGDCEITFGDDVEITFRDDIKIVLTHKETDMGNLDHVQRANADVESCNNCLNRFTKFSAAPCKNCKGENDMFELDDSVPAVLTGRDIGIGLDGVDSLDKAMAVPLDVDTGFKHNRTLNEVHGVTKGAYVS